MDDTPENREAYVTQWESLKSRWNQVMNSQQGLLARKFPQMMDSLIVSFIKFHRIEFERLGHLHRRCVCQE